MIAEFLILFFFNFSDTIDVPYFKDAKITLDGKLNEQVYENACKIKELIQTYPVPFQNIPESTMVFLFQKYDGLVISLRCFTEGRQPDKSSSGDRIEVYLDTYFDRENAYMFLINANGEKGDAKYFNGGEGVDFNVEFLWEGKTHCYDNYFDVEIFIPWKGIMGKKGEWGIDIVRVGPGNSYMARIAPYDATKEKFHISRFKIIRMINLSAKSVTIEIQPILLFHHGEDFGYKYNFKYEYGSNVYLKFKENIKFAFTLKPDFGEVEADPFRLNLSKYPLFYEETRPFFTEGSEFFKFSGFSPYNIFYTRQIGKTLPSGKAIPISFAGKFFIKSNFLEFSMLHARTEKIEELFTTFERADFFVNKVKILPYKFLSITFLNAYKLPYKEKTRGLMGTQIFYNDSLTSLDIENVFDNYISRDFAHQIQFEKIIKNLKFSFSHRSIPDSFSDNEVGFIPWKGEKEVNLDLNYTFFINKKILYFTPHFNWRYGKELGEPYVFSFLPSASFTLNNLISLAPSIGYKKDFEMGNKFESLIFNLFINNLFLTLTKNKFVMYSQISAQKIYNYRKNYIGWVNTNLLWFTLNFKNFSLTNILYQWNEFNPDGKLDESTYSITFRLGLNLPARFSIDFYSNIPISNSRIPQERLGIFISWNPSEKNYIKALYNDFRVKNENTWDPLIRKTTMKLIHSFYF